jgi:hypothetical protein
MAVQNFYDHYHYDDRYVNRGVNTETLRAYTADLVDNLVLTADEKEEVDLAFGVMNYTHRLNTMLRRRGKDQVALALELGVRRHYLGPGVIDAWEDCLHHTATQEKAWGRIEPTRTERSIGRH